jgi:hypothetical protein
MPTLFADLIAIGLLLGGGYGASSWPAAPEPVKVVAGLRAGNRYEKRELALTTLRTIEFADGRRVTRRLLIAATSAD